jgi:hypothetical protein
MELLGQQNQHVGWYFTGYLWNVQEFQPLVKEAKRRGCNQQTREDSLSQLQLAAQWGDLLGRLP